MAPVPATTHQFHTHVLAVLTQCLRSWLAVFASQLVICAALLIADFVCRRAVSPVG